MLATPALTGGLAPSVPRRVRSVVPLLAVVGACAAAASLSFAIEVAHPDPIQVFLIEWLSVPYVVAGLVAWWRRPESRLGLLMVAGGAASALSGWQFSGRAGEYTLGAAFDILPAALFLHVFLAFPDGRLRSRFERGIVTAAYVSAVGLQMVKLALGGVEAQNVLEISAQPGIVSHVERVQLLSLSALLLVGVGLLALRRRRLARPRRRTLAILIDCFAVGLVMAAALFVIAAYDWPGFIEVRRATLFVIGLSPFAFLLGLLDARLARSAVGDLVLELRSDPAPRDLRDALAQALRDPRSPWRTGSRISRPTWTSRGVPWSFPMTRSRRRH